MKTPICDFLDRYAAQDALRLHMPGHKGALEAGDITEIPGADVLYDAKGIIRESQENAAMLFGSGRTLYSTEGSSLCIRAMLYLTRLYGGTGCTIAAGRNAHKTFVTGAALLDIPVKWLYPNEPSGLLSCQITPSELDAFLADHSVTAVYVTSPDYLGNEADIRGLSRVCRAHNTLLLVDNAHGAYLRFLPTSRHPMDLGADLCCDSAHKTLPVLTGGAYLHIGKEAPALFYQQAQAAMSLFASTSPSYLLLRSLDGCNKTLAEDFPTRLARFIPKLERLKQRLLDYGYGVTGTEELKLTLVTKPLGYRGDQLAALLEKQGIYAEFADPDYLVFMFCPEAPGMERLEKALLSIPPAPVLTGKPPALPKPIQAVRPHEALLAEAVTLPADKCLGKVLAAPTVSCPPAVPILVCGERVSEESLAMFSYYGHETLTVLVTDD